jgi:hypothetical protein
MVFAQSPTATLMHFVMCNQYGAGNCGSARLCVAVRPKSAAHLSSAKVGRDMALGRARCGRGGASQGRSHQDRQQPPRDAPTPLNACKPGREHGAERRITAPQSRRLTCPDAQRERQCLASEHVCARAQGRRGREPQLRPQHCSVSAETDYTSAMTNRKPLRPSATALFRPWSVPKHVSSGHGPSRACRHAQFTSTPPTDRLR